MKKINYKLINTLLVIIIIFLIWLMKDLWLGVLTKIIDILLPFILAFAIGYVLHPLLKKMVKRGIPKTLALVIIGGTVVLFISFILCFNPKYITTYF